jgi:electron transfer flavoprotein alpha subunit
MTIVIGEQRDGRLNRATWEAIAAAQSLGPGAITVVVPGADVSAAASEVAAAEVTDVVTLESPALAAYSPDAYTMALASWLSGIAADYVLLPHTYQTRDFAPKLAARLDRAIVTDCTGLKTVGGALTFVRPMFQGKLLADVALEGPPPHFATIQIGAFRADAAKRGPSPAPIASVVAQVDVALARQHPEAPFQEAKQAVDLSQAERIVAIGRGIKAQEHLALAEKLASALGAELAASRPICDNGWLPMERQIGSSGQTVAPRLYVALGISGAIQHVVGMKGSRTIVAVNKDPDAPIFEIADYGIAGDLFEIAPALIAELQK